MQKKIAKANPLDSLPARIQYLAKQIGGQSALAARVELNRHTIWEYATGRRTPPGATLLAIAGLYPCSLDWLEKGEGEPPTQDPGRAVQARHQHRNQKVEEPRRSLRAIERHLQGTSTALPVAAFSVQDMSLRVDVFKLNKALTFFQKLVESNFAQAERILGPNLAHEVRAGRACPNLELMGLLVESLDLPPGLSRDTKGN
jgi:transcriptional regulator with XRE-family HTH domain